MRKIKILKELLFLTIGISYFWCSKIQAQQNSPGQDLLNNIEIMETVLDKLVSPNKAQLHFFGSNTKGYYLMNYGVIFNVNYSLFNERIIALDFDKRLRSNKHNYIFVDQEDEEVSKNFDKEIEKLNKLMVRFLSEWTSALTDLNPDEKVTIIVDFNGFFPTFKDVFDYSTHQRIASVPIKEIANYRKGKITKEEFANKVTFNEVKSVDEDISILSNVIQTSLKHADKKTKLGVAGDVKGIYFKGYGVIFFTDVSFSLGKNAYKRALTIYSDAPKKGEGRSITVESFSDESEKTEKDIEKIEQKMIQLISNYGHNLRTLQPDEWVEIAINFKGIPIKEKYSKSILKVQKKIIDDYKRDRIQFDQFKKRVNIIYY
jgi:hypothetical protein